MASLKGVIEELDGIKVIIEEIGVLLAKAREDIDYLQTRAAELQRAAVLPKQTCPSCSGAGYWIDTTNLHVECRQCKGTGQV